MCRTSTHCCYGSSYYHIAIVCASCHGSNRIVIPSCHRFMFIPSVVHSTLMVLSPHRHGLLLWLCHHIVIRHVMTLTTWMKEGSEHGALRPQKPLRLIRDGDVGRSGIFMSNTYSLHCHHQNDCIKVGSCVSHFNVSLIVLAKSQDSVHKPQFSKRKESRSGSNRGPSVYQPSALPLGHTGSPSRLQIVQILTGAYCRGWVTYL